ncbi:DUF4870 domain-containing protein [Streptacidiphilus sp. P02-A3a]|uniref:DUF4870 domain-containing protein n=1 Tax=Streptacidiphilus sp. P02-A3a TaxID=2704468 RepID=UPI0015F883E7|nr:DUF4870 domain-containing protein [Streptacidiphilus sp. P02-A3a]QMU71426.1 DUF4870 domain-containing protein [Streptacidiphilus sp. P02-A3a]
MDAVSQGQQPPHDVESCGCHSCQLFRYQRQYGPAPAQAAPPQAPPPPPYHATAPSGAGYPPPPPPGWYPPPGYPPAADTATAAEAGGERTMASLAHWLPLVVGLVFSFVIGTLAVFLCFVPPLIVMLTARSEFTVEHAREALNFQLSLVIPGALILVLAMASPPLGALLRLLLLVGCLVIQIPAAVKASQGARYRYPFGIRFVKPSRG